MGKKSEQLASEAPVKLKRKDYEKELRKLQAELCAVQDWVVQTRQRVIIVFEGRDAAGKGQPVHGGPDAGYFPAGGKQTPEEDVCGRRGIRNVLHPSGCNPIQL